LHGRAPAARGRDPPAGRAWFPGARRRALRAHLPHDRALRSRRSRRRAYAVRRPARRLRLGDEKSVAMRALVTGAAGFIGTNFVRQTLARKREGIDRLVALDLLTYAGNYANLTGLESDPRFRFVRGDVADRDRVAALVAEE